MYTLQQRLVLATALVFSVASLVILLATRWIVADAMAQETQRAGERSASLLSAALAPLLAESDLAAVDEQAQALVQRGAFSYLRISDTQGVQIASAGVLQDSEAQGFERALRLGSHSYGQAQFGITRIGERQAAQQVFWQLLAVCLGTLLLAAGLQVYLSRLLTARLGDLRRGADRMAAGEPRVQIEATGRDELARLARAFNQMSATLSERFDALGVAERSLQEANEALEQRVAQRTQHLEDTLRKLRRTQAELVEAQKLASLGALVAGISHELNTPIGNAVTTASTLQDLLHETGAMVQAQQVSRRGLTEALENGEQMASLVLRATQRAAELISSFKRVAVDDSSDQRRSFELQGVLRDLLLSYGPLLKQKSWQIKLEVPEGILMDSYPGPLDQVVGNLIQNAERHAFVGRDAGLLKISATATDEQVELRIQDDGVGMSDETVSRIFEPFFTTKLGQGGSGLGLSIVRNLICGLLGGQITVQSSEGQGSCFIITLPLTAPSRVADTGPGALN
ncbi:HAMP domain-containing sensor histidine kinase [Paucibacter sp. AS339]|uniref:sensor histidine kinase n=1 Tax=Paucibacter hankyongi TaxID=3133434 RepID=UPI0030A731B8